MDTAGLSLEDLIKLCKTLYKSRDWLNLSDIDPNTVSLHKTPQGDYEFQAKTRNNERTIQHTSESSNTLELATDSIAFRLDPSYGPRFTKAFKHAVVLCGGKPSIF
jgi:hypothetical protein